MPQVQVNTIGLNMIIQPRIDGNTVTVSEIKSTYSENYISDSQTPLNFYLQYQSSEGVTNTIAWDTALSTDDFVIFQIPNSVYATLDIYTCLFYWTVYNISAPTVILEQIYTRQPIQLEIVDLNATR